MCLPDVVLCKRSNTLLVLGCSSFCWVGSSDDVIELKQKDQLQVSRMNTAVSTLEATRCYGGPYQRKIVADIFCIDGKIVPQCFFRGNKTKKQHFWLKCFYPKWNPTVKKHNLHGKWIFKQIRFLFYSLPYPMIWVIDLFHL